MRLSEPRVKEAWERAVVEWFLPLYNLSCGRTFRFLRPGAADQGEPDVLCAAPVCGDRIWIEVTTAYYGGAHAKTIHDPARGRVPIQYWLTQPDKVADRRLLLMGLKSLREKIGRPANHYYAAADPIILLVFFKSFRFFLGRGHVRRHVQRLRVRGGNPYSEVYLLSEAPEICQVYPHHRWIPAQRPTAPAEARSSSRQGVLRLL